MALEKIDFYEIQSVISRGEMSTISLAIDPRDGRQAVVKIFSSDCLNDATIRARYQHEFQLITFLNNPCIVPVYGFGEQDGQLYIAMQWMPGGSLADRLTQGPLPFDEAATLVQQISQALDAVHGLGIFHGDIKPANILFDPQGKACLSDFGMIKLARARNARTEHILFGPPGYISPEQAEAGQAQDGRSDVYMLAVVLFESLTGQLPFQANSPLGLAVQHTIAPLPNLFEINPRLPPGCEAVFQRALAKDPAARYPTAGQFASAVGNIGAQPEAQEAPAANIALEEKLVEIATNTLTAGEAAAPPKKLRAPRSTGRARKRSYNPTRVRILAGLVLLSLIVGWALILGQQMIGPLSLLASSGMKAPTYGQSLVNTLRVAFVQPGLDATEETLKTGTFTVTAMIAPSPGSVPQSTETAMAPASPTTTITASPVPEPATPTATPTPAPTRTPTVYASPTPTAINSTNYAIAYGDTLFTIARQFHVVMNELMGVNNLQCNDALPTAKKLVIPPSYFITLPIFTPIGVNMISRLERLYILDCTTDVTVIKFSPDGRVMAVASGNFVYLWQVDGWKPLARLAGHQAKVNSLDFSFDSQTIVTGADDSTVRIWNASDGAPIRTFKGHTNKVTNVAFSPGGQIIASTSLDMTVRLWRIDGSPLASLSGYPTFSVAFSANGDTLAVGCADSVKLYRTSDLAIIQTFPSADVIRQLAFSPDGYMLVSSSDAWQIADGQHIYHFGSFGDHLAFSQDGQVLAIGKRLFQVSNGKLLSSLKSPVEESSRIENVWDSVALSPDGGLLAWGTPDGLFVWTLPLGTPVDTGAGSNTYIVQPGDNYWNIANQFQVKPATLRSVNGLGCANIPFLGQHLTIPSSDNVASELKLETISASNIGRLQPVQFMDMECVLGADRLHFGSDGQTLISGSALWRVGSGSVIIQALDFPHQASGASQTNLDSPVLVLSPDNKTLAIRQGSAIELWEVSTGRLLRTLLGHTGIVTSMAFSPDGTRLASGSGVDELVTRIWSVADGSMLQTLPGSSAVNLLFTPDGQYLILEGDNAVRLWQLSNNRVLYTLTNVEGSLALSPDGNLLAYASCKEWVSNTCQTKLTSIAKVADGTVSVSLQGFEKDIQDIQFSPDGQNLAVASGYTILVYPVGDWSGFNRLHVPGNLIPVREIFYSPDSALLFSTAEDNTLRAWEISSGSLLQTFAGSRVDDIAFSSDITRMALLRGNAVILWEVKP